MTGPSRLLDCAWAIREDQPGRDDAEREFYQAVAGWLFDSALTLCHRHDNEGDCSTNPNGCIVHAPALTVATAYLGEWKP